MSYNYGYSGMGQRILYDFGMTGIPIININNSGASGGTTVYLGYNDIKGGIRDCVLACGFEKMYTGPLSRGLFTDRLIP